MYSINRAEKTCFLTALQQTSELKLCRLPKLLWCYFSLNKKKHTHTCMYIHFWVKKKKKVLSKRRYPVIQLNFRNNVWEWKGKKESLFLVYKGSQSSVHLVGLIALLLLSPHCVLFQKSKWSSPPLRSKEKEQQVKRKVRRGERVLKEEGQIGLARIWNLRRKKNECLKT